MQAKRVLLTGATGFIGAHCLRALVASGASDIHAVSRSGHGPALARVRWHAADLRDGEQAASLITRVRPTHLLHGAWIATPGVYMTSQENLAWLAASVRMFAAFAGNGGVRIVGVGSSAEYAPDEAPCHEDTTSLDCRSLYGRAKRDCGLALMATAKSEGIQAAWVRVFLPYGPGDAAARLIPTVVAALRAKQDVKLSEGTQARDFINVLDVADLLVRLLDSDVQGAFNCGTGHPSTVRQVIQQLAGLMKASSYLKFGALPMRQGEPQTLVADMSKVFAHLGWSAPTSLEDGLATIVRAAEERS